MPRKFSVAQVLHPRQQKSDVRLAGACLALFGLVFGLAWEPLFNLLVHKAIRFRPGSALFEVWKSPPMRVEYDFYLYNWTNPEDFYNKSSKPRLQQLGPYRFVETSHKFDIRWHEHNSTVTFRKRSFFHFDAAGSRGKLSDEITTLDAISVVGASIINRWNYFRRQMFTMAMSAYGTDVAMRTTVDRLLFTGQRSLIFNMLNTMPSILQEEMPFDKFGYCYMRNGSAFFWGEYNMHTGADDISRLGRIHSWNGKTHTGKYASYCGLVNGTTGELQPPDVRPGDTLEFFVSDLCRSLRLDYADAAEVDGVRGLRFVGGLRALDNGSLYPENECFRVDERLPTGLLNIGPCWFKAPMYVSYPHFYRADPVYLAAVEGLAPNKEDHELHVVVEPRTGLVLKVRARLQLNILVKPVPGFKIFQNAPSIYFPVIWVDERTQIPPEYSQYLRLVPFILIAGKVLGGVCAIVGLMMVRRCSSHIDSFAGRVHSVNFSQFRPAGSRKAFGKEDDDIVIFPLVKRRSADVDIVVKSTSVDRLDADSDSSASLTPSLHAHLSSSDSEK